MGAYRDEASWAVWETDASGELSASNAFPQTDIEHVHGRAMIVSLNPASRKNPEGTGDHPNWANFHSPHPRHNDGFLAAALIGTQYWGSYMTDLHPEVWESKSGLVKPAKEAIAQSVDGLIEQARLLGSVRAIICVGRRSHTSISAHAGRIHASLGPTSVIGIPHYSGAAAAVHRGNAGTYREAVHIALGLRS